MYGNLVGDYGFFADNEYRILYRNKKNTKWIIHLKCGADKVDLIKKCICPECQSDLIDINKRFKELKKKKGVSSCFFCKNEEMGVEYKTWFN